MYARDTATFATPIGTVAVQGIDDVIVAVRIGDEATRHGGSGAVALAVEQIEQWFAGERTGFDLPLAPCPTPRGATLREAIVTIGYGRTASYGALAAAIGSGARAIGQACARNPLPIVVPCHRVIGATGVLGAYSAGDGPITKRWLLNHERRFRRDRIDRGAADLADAQDPGLFAGDFS